MVHRLYPLIFTPVFTASEAGATEIAPWFTDFCRSVDLPLPEAETVDECWLLADSPTVQTEVANGPLAGTRLRRLVADYPRELVGPSHTPDAAFPLCCRFFATTEDQPLQVHPDSSADPQLRRNHASMKLWYSLSVRPDACAFIGINPSASAQQLLGQLNTAGAQRFLQKFKIRPGDSCLVPPGIIHALSAGNLIWEVKTSPAPPLRLGGWQTGRPVEEAEREAARQCIRMESRQSARTARMQGPLTHTRKIPLTRHWPYFTVEEIRIADHIFLDTTGDSCQLLYPVSGNLTVHCAGSEPLSLPSGRICCIPAGLGQYKLTAAGQAEVLRTIHHRQT